MVIVSSVATEACVTALVGALVSMLPALDPRLHAARLANSTDDAMTVLGEYAMMVCMSSPAVSMIAVVLHVPCFGGLASLGGRPTNLPNAVSHLQIA
jgi:hypothetical protein